ncbi:hypothetical protein [Haladaptatus sp. DYF46]|uniref:hypothetical protein n=1 Tax=Haladaptatus sp. DYF46 TaxID=2886041 RepID=UPI001E2E7229|nr:hypothetical protein [Haladaptatus sp. DYF46]
MTSQQRRLPLWFGRSSYRSLWFLVFAAVLFLCLFALHVPAIAGELASYGIPVGFGVDLVILFALMLIPAALNAYLNDGLLISIALAASPLFGVVLGSMLYTSPLSQLNYTTLFHTTLPFMAIAIGLAAGLGFVLGSGARRLRA